MESQRFGLNGRFIVSAVGLFLFAISLLCGTAEAGERRWAVIVGIDDYLKDVTPLHCAVNDAETLRRTLIEKSEFRDGDIFLLTSRSSGNHIPDKSNIIRWMSYIKAHANSQDTVVFFFSGHGMDCGDESYLLTCEADPYSRDTLDISSLRVSDLRKMMEGIAAGKILLFIDACRNDPRSGKGDADNWMTAGQSRSLCIPSGYSPDVRTGGNFSLTFFSCRVGQRSYEWTEQKMGFFTFYLAKGMGGAQGALDRNGSVTLGSLKRYLGREVPSAVKRERGAAMNQEPWVTGDASADADLWAISGPNPVQASEFGQAAASRERPLSEKDRAEQRYMEGDDHYYLMLGYIDLGYPRAALSEWQKSYDAYTEAIKLNPSFSEAYSSRGVLIATVVEELGKTDAYSSRGILPSESGEYQAALKDCNKALELNPGSAQAYNNRAAMEYRMGELDKVVEDCTKAIQLDPDLITAYNMRGSVFMKRGDFDRAIGDFTRELKIDGRRSPAYDYRGRAFLKKGDFDRAVEDFTKAVEYRPRYMPGYFHRAIAYFSMKLHQKALADCDSALALSPRYAEAYGLKAQILENMGRKSEAAEALNRYRQLTSNSPASPDGKKAEAAPGKQTVTNGAESKLKEIEEKLRRLEGK